MLEKLLSAQADIEARIKVSTEGVFVSDRFLRDLYQALLNRDDKKLPELISDNKEILDKIRYELARIPIQLNVVKRPYAAGYTSTELYTPVGRKVDRHYLDFIYEVEDDTVWGLCSERNARMLRIGRVPCWREKESLVDWVQEGAWDVRYHRPHQEKDTPTTQQPATTETEQHTEPRQTETQPRPKQVIYDYIQAHSPVKTKEILEQNIASRSRTFTILKTLERENKIEKSGHGVYDVKSTSG